MGSRRPLRDVKPGGFFTPCPARLDRLVQMCLGLGPRHRHGLGPESWEVVGASCTGLGAGAKPNGRPTNSLTVDNHFTTAAPKASIPWAVRPAATTPRWAPRPGQYLGGRHAQRPPRPADSRLKVGIEPRPGGPPDPAQPRSHDDSVIRHAARWRSGSVMALVRWGLRGLPSSCPNRPQSESPWWHVRLWH